ncbi:hypothetical protein SJ05684_b51850 (plasmid) [Sinorhizobium sojae CCBAU 05684]|uniref:Uncharacterized protein n=1 Tax=Sinorhizobium sojae CCBAU 05684 TaxID=716928 RepID=A0A249PK97_9HYPH|nr:hypothetical protein SJ05684_b51850 [Sinorhizobium sojae CCBAU 05684]
MDGRILARESAFDPLPVLFRCGLMHAPTLPKPTGGLK